MGTITINGKKYEFTNEKNVLTIIRNAGIEVPTLCYQPELSIFGACRLCTVEDDRGRCFASCSEEPRDGMVIFTHTERLRKHRKLIVELLLAAHCRDCTTCDKHGKCKLQKLAYQLGINQVRFENHREVMPVDFSSPAIVRDPNKCILCGNCVRACTELQGIGVLGFAVFLGLSFLLARWAVKPVETAWNQQRQFVADASHELKTPLTVILTNAELLQEPEYDEQARSRFVDSIMTMSHQMRGLVESLLELARVDNGGQNLVFSRLNFSELVSDALLPFEPVYFEKGLTLDNGVEEKLFVKGSQQHLKQVADILLDNASKYASADSTVRVILRRQGSHCLLSVASAGDAISREDLKNIFKRFYRMDKARSMNHSYGLGLSIADSIVSKHGGKIWAESADGVNTFFVQLPPA